MERGGYGELRSVLIKVTFLTRRLPLHQPELPSLFSSEDCQSRGPGIAPILEQELCIVQQRDCVSGDGQESVTQDGPDRKPAS